jgi:hypothetical protein
MATEILVQRGPGNTLIPFGEDGVKAIQSMKHGETVKAVITRPRNIKFHRKFFSLLNFGFDYWEPAPYTKINEKGFKGARKFARFVCDNQPDLYEPLKKMINEFSKSYTGTEVEPEKNFEQFRQDVIILAGYYDSFFRLDGSLQIKAKSISFASMDESEFNNLYKAVFNVIWNLVVSKISGFTEAMMENALNQLLEYD